MLNTKLGALLQHPDIRRRRWAALPIWTIPNRNDGPGVIIDTQRPLPARQLLTLPRRASSGSG
jgi:hypothetical protein